MQITLEIGNKEKQRYIDKSICLLATRFTIMMHYQAILLSIKIFFLASIFPSHIIKSSLE